jgi:5-methylcytosine-specific restriction endonuclease McrA
MTRKKVTKGVTPKPYKKLTKEQYAEALQHPKWQKKRLKIFERDKWKCKDCGDTETALHIHHIKYTKKYPWHELDKNLRTICQNCHRKVHKIKY